MVQFWITWILFFSFLFYTIGGVLAYGRYKANQMTWSWDGYDEVAAVGFSLLSWVAFVIGIMFRDRETTDLMWKKPLKYKPVNHD